MIWPYKYLKHATFNINNQVLWEIKQLLYSCHTVYISLKLSINTIELETQFHI